MLLFNTKLGLENLLRVQAENNRLVTKSNIITVRWINVSVLCYFLSGCVCFCVVTFIIRVNKRLINDLSLPHQWLHKHYKAIATSLDYLSACWNNWLVEQENINPQQFKNSINKSFFNAKKARNLLVPVNILDCWSIKLKNYSEVTNNDESKVWVTVFPNGYIKSNSRLAVIFPLSSRITGPMTSSSKHPHHCIIIKYKTCS